MKTDQDAVKKIGFSQGQKPGGEHFGRVPEGRRGMAGPEEHMPDAHLGHHGHAVGKHPAHGAPHPLFRGHGFSNISPPPDIVKNRLTRALRPQGETNSSMKSPQRVIDPLFPPLHNESRQPQGRHFGQAKPRWIKKNGFRKTDERQKDIGCRFRRGISHCLV